MAKYSAMLEPVTQFLQAVQLDVLKVHDHIHQLVVISLTHRREAEVHFNGDIMVHQQKVMDRNDAVTKDVIDRFGSERRRLQFLFSQ